MLGQDPRAVAPAPSFFAGRRMEGVQRVLCALALSHAAFAFGCGSDSVAEERTLDFATAVEAPGERCEAGGVALMVDGEVVEYVCDGREGEPGAIGEAGPMGAAGSVPEGLSAAVEPPGEHCPVGGFVLSAGDETLGYVCQGQQGPSGDPGLDGLDGADGSDGADGADGADAPGGHLLLTSTPIAAGADSTCPYGGQELTWGDDSGELDGMLDPAEIAGSATACIPTPAGCSGDILVRSNASVAALATCGPVIIGNLTISDPQVTDLSPLAQLEEVRGTLRIGAIGTSDLSALSNLHTVTGDLFFGEQGLPLMADMSGLGGLRRVGGMFWFNDDQSVEDFTDLSSLEHVGRFAFGYTSSVSSFKGLVGLTTLTLASLPPRLTSFEGLEHVTALYGARITLPLENPWYPSVPRALPSIAPLAGLVHVDGLSFASELDLAQVDLSSLSNLRSVGDLSIRVNGDFSALGNLQEITGDLTLAIDTSVTTGLDGLLANVTRIGGSLRLEGAVGHASFLSQLESIGYGLNVSGLADFRDFPNLLSLGADAPDMPLDPTSWLGAQLLAKCGMTSLATVGGSVRYYDQGGAQVTTEAASYFDQLPMPACP